MFSSVLSKRLSPQEQYLRSLNLNQIIQELSNGLDKLQESGACCSSCACTAHQLTLDNPAVRNLCQILDAFLKHGLTIPPDGYWPMVREFLSKDLCEDLLSEWKPGTAAGRGLAWMYSCLNDGTLSCEFATFQAHEAIVKKYYSSRGFLREHKALHAVSMLLRQLDGLRFHLKPGKEASPPCVCSKKSSLTDSNHPKVDSPDVENSVPDSADVIVTRKPNLKSNRSKHQVNRNSANLETNQQFDNGGRRLSDRAKAKLKPSNLEVTVADVTECAALVGIDPTDSEFLSSAEFCTEALDYQPSFTETLLSSRSVNLGYGSNPDYHGNRKGGKQLRKYSSQSIIVNVNGGYDGQKKRSGTEWPYSSGPLASPGDNCSSKDGPKGKTINNVNRNPMVISSTPMMESFRGSLTIDDISGASRAKPTTGTNSHKNCPPKRVFAVPCSGTFEYTVTDLVTSDLGGLRISPDGCSHPVSPPFQSSITPITGGHGKQRSFDSTASSVANLSRAATIDEQIMSDTERDLSRFQDGDSLQSELGMECTGCGKQTCAEQSRCRSEESQMLKPVTVFQLSDDKPMSGAGGIHKTFRCGSSTPPRKGDRKCPDGEVNNNSLEFGQISPIYSKSAATADALFRHIVSGAGPPRAISQAAQMYRMELAENNSGRGDEVDDRRNSVDDFSGEYEQQILHRLSTVSNRLKGPGSGSSLIDNLSIEKDPPVVEQPKSSGKEHQPSHQSQVLLESGEVVDLAMHIFVDEGEQFYKMFRVHVGCNLGTPGVRYLVLTNRALYVVRKLVLADAVQTHRNEFTVQYEQLDYVTLSLNYQIISLFLKDKRSTQVICTADELLTRHIMSSLELAVRRSGRSGAELPNVLTDATAQRLCLQKWAAAETHLHPLKCRPALYSLVYWRNLDYGSTSMQSPARSGYLFNRILDPTSFHIMSPPKWNKSYFLLRGKKLYQFADSTCKIGEKVYDFRCDIVACRKVATKHQQHCVDVLLADDMCLQLACPTQQQLQQWFQALVFSLSQPLGDDALDGAVSCAAVITSQHLLLCQENSGINFVRTLGHVTFQQVTAVQSCVENQCLVLDVEADADFGGRWILGFACENELHKFLDLFVVQWKENSQTDLIVNESIELDLIENCADVYSRWEATSGS